VRRRDGDWYIGDSGVQVYGAVSMWQQGYSPEEIQTSFPAISLAEVCGAILFYLEHREEMEAHFREADERYRRVKAEAEAQHPAFYTEMRERVARFRAGQQRPAAS